MRFSRIGIVFTGRPSVKYGMFAYRSLESALTRNGCAVAYYIGLDLGGTNIKAGVVDDTGHVMSRASVATGAQGGPEVVVEAMADAAHQVANEAALDMSRVAAVGIGAPGPLDIESGRIEDAPNMPGWANIALRDQVSQALGRPAVLENDANAAAFSEFWVGAGRDPDISDLIMLTLGTGIGSGIVVGGKIMHGKFGRGGEVGHMMVEPNGRSCGCGQKGCLEAYASASRTGQRAIEAVQQMRKGQTSKLREIYEHNNQTLSAKDVFDAAKASDGLAVQIVEKTALYLSIACVNLCRIFDPQLIVFAGGMILAGPYLFDLIHRSFEQQTWSVASSSVRIVPAQLGNSAGFIGAAGIAWEADRTGRFS